MDVTGRQSKVTFGLRRFGRGISRLGAVGLQFPVLRADPPRRLLIPQTRV